MKPSYSDPAISLRECLDLWIPYVEDGQEHRERLQFLSVPQFRQYAARLCRNCPRAADQLYGIVESVQLSEPIDRWWCVNRLLELGCRLEDGAEISQAEPIQFQPKVKRTRKKTTGQSVAA